MHPGKKTRKSSLYRGGKKEDLESREIPHERIWMRKVQGKKGTARKLGEPAKGIRDEYESGMC